MEIFAVSMPYEGVVSLFASHESAVAFIESCREAHAMWVSWAEGKMLKDFSLPSFLSHVKDEPYQYAPEFFVEKVTVHP